jgi:hypothetical protein
MTGNNPPDVVLELTMEQAEFLLRNCDHNIGFALHILQNNSDRASAERTVALTEKFKEIRNKLRKQGVKS